MTFQFKLIIFIVASIVIAWISRASLRDFRSHGFYRFLAWEAMLVLVLLNINYWFYEPFSTHQIIAWLLLIISLFLVIYGVQLLHQAAKSESERSDPSLMGVFFKQPSWLGVCLAAMATFFLTMTAKTEEAENIRFFGATYQSYMKQSRMFIPFLF